MPTISTERTQITWIKCILRSSGHFNKNSSSSQTQRTEEKNICFVESLPYPICGQGFLVRKHMKQNPVVSPNNWRFFPCSWMHILTLPIDRNLMHWVTLFYSWKHHKSYPQNYSQFSSTLNKTTGWFSKRRNMKILTNILNNQELYLVMHNSNCTCNRQLVC